MVTRLLLSLMLIVSEFAMLKVSLTFNIIELLHKMMLNNQRVLSFGGLKKIRLQGEAL